MIVKKSTVVFPNFVTSYKATKHNIIRTRPRVRMKKGKM